ncbi:MAG: hypothetical protein M3P50_01000, partial [Actinomycetota bacterium]|nr:hypothetical protein [Actinomycetota bacterium]
MAAFPGSDPGNDRPTVLLPAPGVVDVVTPRRTSSAQTYLSRSTDGGRSFGVPVQILDDFSQRAALLGDGRVVLASALTSLNGAVVRPDGADGELGSTGLSDEGVVEATAAAAANDAFVASANVFGPA